tara:strand:- start:889 stop:1248 length:360 start_codon:yes stop_codon:yes gene_type:complete
MESIKSQMKIPISLDLHMTISKLAEKNEIDKDSALEAGAFVAAQFMESVKKTKFENNQGPLSKEELQAIFEIIGDFYSESFKGQFTQSDFDSITQKAMSLIMSSNKDTIISNYFNKLMQ